MARTKNPLSKRNLNAEFPVREVLAALEKKGRRVELAASKRARVVRERGEFDLQALASLVRPPRTPSGAYAWTLEAIMAARDDQMAGRFLRPARLAESFNTDDALFTARSVRLAPIQSLDVKIVAGRGPKADKAADEADALFGRKGIAFSRATENSIRACLIDHGIAFGAISVTPRADGSRWDPVLTAWPIEWVRWDPIANCYVTRVDPSCAPANENDAEIAANDIGSVIGPWDERIIHGNGRWVIFTKSELLPHRSADATLLAAALVWPCHAFANRDRRKGSASHGNAKIIGELPETVALTDENGDPTAEAAAFMSLLESIASQDSPFGIRPFGAKVDVLANPSGMWQVFSELAHDAEKAAARIYLGTDGVLGAQGGAPGVDVAALFGVHMTKIQSDMACINDALQTGLIEPWCAWNFGDSKQAPTRSYVFPDPDEDAERESFAKRNAAFNADVAAYRANGFVVDQELIDAIAERHGVPAPKLPTAPSGGSIASTPATPSNDAAPSDDAPSTDAATPPPR